MRVLIDTNVLLDVLMGRQPYYDISDNILKYLQLCRMNF